MQAVAAVNAFEYQEEIVRVGFSKQIDYPDQAMTRH
jgi:hypothetical protein